MFLLFRLFWNVVNLSNQSCSLKYCENTIGCYPFGMIMPNRNYNAGSYRYGFQGQEQDDEIKGVGNSLSFRFRIYDPRISKFLSVDPLTKSYPWFTPYQFAGNTPIQAIDIEGVENLHYTFTMFLLETKLRISKWRDETRDGIREYSQGATGTADVNNEYVPESVQSQVNQQQQIHGGVDSPKNSTVRPAVSTSHC